MNPILNLLYQISGIDEIFTVYSFYPFPNAKYSFTTLLEKYGTLFFLRKPGEFQLSAPARGDLEPSYAYVNFFRLPIASGPVIKVFMKSGTLFVESIMSCDFWVYGYDPELILQ